jgi:uncharacterized membrane protein YdjX (TVP38/TMEM64 family)
MHNNCSAILTFQYCYFFNRTLVRRRIILQKMYGFFGLESKLSFMYLLFRCLCPFFPVFVLAFSDCVQYISDCVQCILIF